MRRRGEHPIGEGAESPGSNGKRGRASLRDGIPSSERLRILMTTDTVGGVWSYALELAGGLARGSATVALATMGQRPTPAQRARAGSVPGLRLFESDYALEWMDDPWEDVARAGDWLLDLERSFEPDVVHLNGYAHGALPFRAPTLVVGHSCVLSWWEAVQRTPLPGKYRRYRQAVRQGLRGADRVVAPTAAMLRLLERHYGALPHGAVVANGRSPGRFSPGPEEQTIFACGRFWDEAKNLAALERAAPEVDWPIVVAGSTEHPEGHASVKPRAVRCLGAVSPEEVAEHMGRAAICAHPACYEPFGLVPLEAALSGCALVLGDLPSLREVWGDAAIYVDPHDPDELTRALRQLTSADSRRRELAERARDRAARLTPERMTRLYLGHYWDLLGGRLRTVPAKASAPLPPQPVSEEAG